MEGETFNLNGETAGAEGPVLFKMKSWKWLLLLILSMFGAVLLYGFAGFIPTTVENVYAMSILSLAACAAMLGIYAVVFRFIEHRRVSELKLSRLAPDLGTGFAVGTICIAVSILGMWLTGVYHTSISSPDWEGIVRNFFLFIVFAVGEELVFRGVLLRMIEERWGTTIALVVSCLAFGFIHYTNEGGTLWSSIAIALTAVEAALFIYSRTLWMPIGSHLAWNFVQGSIFGVPVSGNEMDSSLLQAEISGPELLTGGAFGMEASVITVILTTAIAALFIYLAIRKGHFIPFRNPWRKA